MSKLMDPNHHQSGQSYPNPYAYWQPGPSNLSSYYYNSHYLQAYAPQNNVPQHAAPVNYAPVNLSNITQRPSYASMSSWYQPGNHRCTYRNCTFTGSPKSVEIHMMDRHLIYPPGWEKQKKKSDWDADPSLKGKPIPIQGTSVILDTPEATAAWIAERRKRFPTKDRVEEKKRKMEEAIARGQLDLSEGQNKRPFKRQKTDVGPSSASQHHRKRQENRRGGGGGGGVKQQQGSGPHQHHQQRQQQQQVPGSTSVPVPANLPAKPTLHASLPSKPVLAQPKSQSDVEASSENEESDDDGEPEIISSKIGPAPERVIEPEQESNPSQEEVQEKHDEQKIAEVQTKNIPPNKPHRIVRPPNPPRNPFASRPTLLRNLLLPEIRVTVSNLSQAIHFLVDNDFLRNVELKPGQAAEENNRIQVISSSNSGGSVH